MNLWRAWMLKVAALLSWNTGYAEGYAAGESSGVQEARVFASLINQYGSFDAIPTQVLADHLPTQGEAMIGRQRLKLAAIQLRLLVEAAKLPPIDKLIDLVCKYLEYDQSITDDEITEVELVIQSPFVFHSLMRLAEKTDSMDAEAFISAMHHECNKPHLFTYYRCLKNDHYIVR